MSSDEQTTEPTYNNDPARIAAFIKHCADLDVEPDRPYSGAEDYHDVLAGHAPCREWCVFTEAPDGDGDSFVYANPRFDDRASAEAYAIENISDGIYAENPVAIVNLDTGLVVEPDWTTLRWTDDAPRMSYTSYPKNGETWVTSADNRERADWADAAIKRFRDVCRGDADMTAIVDLLANIGHAFDRMMATHETDYDPGYTFRDAIDMALRHYDDERDMDGEG